MAVQPLSACQRARPWSQPQADLEPATGEILGTVRPWSPGALGGGAGVGSPRAGSNKEMEAFSRLRPGPRAAERGHLPGWLPTGRRSCSALCSTFSLLRKTAQNSKQAPVLRLPAAEGSPGARAGVGKLGSDFRLAGTTLWNICATTAHKNVFLWQRFYEM